MDPLEVLLAGLAAGAGARMAGSSSSEVDPMDPLGLRDGLPLPSQGTTAGMGSSTIAPKTGPGAQVQHNYEVGQRFDDYVAEKELKALDESGQLARQEQLPTPDVAGRKYVVPDYTIYRRDGYVAAYADAKSGLEIGLDAQAHGLVRWAGTTRSRVLVFYTPTATTPISRSLIRYAQANGVRIVQVKVP
jgi:hypothetical protein